MQERSGAMIRVSRDRRATRGISRACVIFIKTWRLSRREADDGPATKATYEEKTGTWKVIYADQSFSTRENGTERGGRG